MITSFKKRKQLKHSGAVKPYNLKLLSFETLFMPENPCFNWYVVWNVINCLSIPNLDLCKSYWQEDARKTARECRANNCCMHVVHCSWNKMSEFRTVFDNPWKNLPRHLAPDTIKKKALKGIWVWYITREINRKWFTKNFLKNNFPLLFI